MSKLQLKKLSVRKQLTLWYALIILIISVVLFTSFFLLTKRYLSLETDRSLSIHASQIAYSVALNTNNTHDTQTKDILSLSQKEVPGIFVEIVDAQGFTSDGTASNFQTLSNQAVASNAPVFAQKKTGDLTMRVIAYPIKNADTAFGAVVMGHPIDIYEKTLEQLKKIGIIVLFFIITPAILIGYLLARSATSPITKLGKAFNKVTSENLARSIDLPVSSEETEILVTNFNSLLDRLGKAFNFERQFLGEMAHEVKTPLAVIKTNSEVTLSKDRTTAEYRQAMQQTLEQVDKLTKSLLSLMDFAWSQSTDVKNMFTEVNLSQLMSEISSVAKYSATPKQIRIQHSIVENIIIFGKEDKLYQAIYNILDNAIKFTPEKGIVSINLFTEKDSAIIEIKDTGIGIDKAQQKDIFNRFYRTEQNINIAGHGLGLAIADSIIKAHDGRIELTSEKGKGSTFRVVFKIKNEI